MGGSITLIGLSPPSDGALHPLQPVRFGSSLGLSILQLFQKAAYSYLHRSGDFLQARGCFGGSSSTYKIVKGVASCNQISSMERIVASLLGSAHYSISSSAISAPTKLREKSPPSGSVCIRYGLIVLIGIRSIPFK